MTTCDCNKSSASKGSCIKAERTAKLKSCAAFYFSERETESSYVAISLSCQKGCETIQYDLTIFDEGFRYLCKHGWRLHEGLRKRDIDRPMPVEGESDYDIIRDWNSPSNRYGGCDDHLILCS